MHRSAKRILVLGSFPDSVASFRGDLIRWITNAGVEVTVMTAPASQTVKEEIESLGTTGSQRRAKAGLCIGDAGDGEKGRVSFRPFSIQRNRLSPRNDLKTVRELKRAFRELQPDVILAYTIKPIIWGAIAARVLPSCRFVALVTGLGYAFQGTSIKRRLLNGMVVRLYRHALRRAEAVVFQNSDNRDVFLNRRIVPFEKCDVVAGSGINVEQFVTTPLPDGPPHFLLIARLLGEKGIREYAAAAEKVHEKYPQARFSLVGPPDPSPDGIPISEIQDFHNRGVLIYHGSTRDVRPFLTDCHVYCLPSYHEGMPRTVLEAMAMARPILTTNVSGCRETVVDGNNGWLVPKSNVDALAERMIWFIENRQQWLPMGLASRKMAEQKFDVRTINHQMLKILGIANAGEEVS